MIKQIVYGTSKKIKNSAALFVRYSLVFLLILASLENTPYIDINTVLSSGKISLVEHWQLSSLAEQEHYIMPDITPYMSTNPRNDRLRLSSNYSKMRYTIFNLYAYSYSQILAVLYFSLILLAIVISIILAKILINWQRKSDGKKYILSNKLALNY